MAGREFAHRAPRYAIPLAVLYRASGERAWLEGRTENISKTGVLVRAEHTLVPPTWIEMLLDIPADLPSPFSGTTICRGRIVRAVGPSTLERRPAFAATITEYETSRVFDPRRI